MACVCGETAGDLYTRLERVCSIKTPSNTRCAVRHHSSPSKHAMAKRPGEENKFQSLTGLYML